MILVVNETRHIQGYLVLKLELNNGYIIIERILKLRQGSWKLRKDGTHYNFIIIHRKHEQL